MTNNVLSHSVDEVVQERNKRMDNYSYKLQTGGYGLDVQFGQHFDINENEMSVTIPFADGNRRDGVGDLLEVGGIDTERHRKNPIFLFDHGKQISLPVGKTEDPKTGEYTVFLDPQSKVASCKAFFYQGGSSYEHGLFCEQLFDLIAKKFIRAGSIGYLVKMAQKLPPQYETGTPQGLHLLSTLMLEASTVVLPANQDTIRKALCLSESCGKPLSPYLIKSLASYVDEAQCKVISGYESKAKQRPRDRFAPQFAHHMNVENSKPVYPHTIHGTTEEQDLMNRYKEEDDVASVRPAWDQPHEGEIEDGEKAYAKNPKATRSPMSRERANQLRSDYGDRHGNIVGTNAAGTEPLNHDEARQNLREDYYDSSRGRGNFPFIKIGGEPTHYGRQAQSHQEEEDKKERQYVQDNPEEFRDIPSDEKAIDRVSQYATEDASRQLSHARFYQNAEELKGDKHRSREGHVDANTRAKQSHNDIQRNIRKKIRGEELAPKGEEKGNLRKRVKSTEEDSSSESDREERTEQRRDRHDAEREASGLDPRDAPLRREEYVDQEGRYRQHPTEFEENELKRREIQNNPYAHDAARLLSATQRRDETEEDYRHRDNNLTNLRRQEEAGWLRSLRAERSRRAEQGNKSQPNQTPRDDSPAERERSSNQALSEDRVEFGNRYNDQYAAVTADALKGAAKRREQELQQEKERIARNQERYRSSKSFFPRASKGLRQKYLNKATDGDVTHDPEFVENPALLDRMQADRLDEKIGYRDAISKLERQYDRNMARRASQTNEEKALKKDKVAEQQIEDQRRRMHIDRRLNTPDFDKARLTENSKRTLYGPGGKPTNTPPDPVAFQDQVNDQMRTSGAFDMEPEEPEAEEKSIQASPGQPYATNLPPARWRPGAGAIKALRRKYRTKSSDQPWHVLGALTKPRDTSDIGISIADEHARHEGKEKEQNERMRDDQDKQTMKRQEELWGEFGVHKKSSDDIDNLPDEYTPEELSALEAENRRNREYDHGYLRRDAEVLDERDANRIRNQTANWRGRSNKDIQMGQSPQIGQRVTAKVPIVRRPPGAVPGPPEYLKDPLTTVGPSDQQGIKIQDSVGRMANVIVNDEIAVEAPRKKLRGLQAKYLKKATNLPYDPNRSSRAYDEASDSARTQAREALQQRTRRSEEGEDPAFQAYADWQGEAFGHIRGPHDETNIQRHDQERDEQISYELSDHEDPKPQSQQDRERRERRDQLRGDRERSKVDQLRKDRDRSKAKYLNKAADPLKPLPVSEMDQSQLRADQATHRELENRMDRDYDEGKISSRDYNVTNANRGSRQFGRTLRRMELAGEPLTESEQERISHTEGKNFAQTRQRMQKPSEGKSVSGYQVKSEPTDEQKRRAAERKRVNRSKQSEETHDYGSESVARKSSKDEEQAHREYAEQRGNRSKEPFPPSSVIPVNDRASHASRRGADPATVDQLRREEEHNIQLNAADHSRRELLRAELRDSKRDRDAARKRGEEYNGPDPNDEYERISQATHEMDAARLGRTQEANAQHERRRAEHLKQQNEGKSVSGYKVKSEPTDEQKRRAAERERVTNNTESEETHDYTRDSYSPKRSKDSYLSQSELDASGYTEYDDDDEIEDLEDETAVARENQNYRNEIGDASDHYNNVIHRTQRGGPYGIRTDSGESLRGWEEREQAGAELAQTMQRAEQNQRSSRERRYQQYQKQEAQRKDEEAQAQNARNSKFDFGKSLFQKTKELRSKYRVKSADSDTVFVSSHIRTKAKKKEPPSFTPKTTEELAQRRRLGLEHERHTEESGMWEGSRRFLAENPEYFRDPKKVTEASREYREVTGKRQPPRRSWEDFPEEDLPKTSQEEQKSFSKKTKGLRAKYKTQRYPNPSKIEPRKRADRAESRGAYPTAVAGQRAAGDQAEEAHEMLRKNPTSANLREYSGTMDAISDGDQNSRASSERIMNATPEQLERYQRQRYREDMEEQNR